MHAQMSVLNIVLKRSAEANVSFSILKHAVNHGTFVLQNICCL